MESTIWRISTRIENSSLDAGLKLLSILWEIRPVLKMKYIFQLVLNLEWKNQNGSIKVKAIAAATIFYSLQYCCVWICNCTESFWYLRCIKPKYQFDCIFIIQKNNVGSKIFQVTPIKQKKEVHYGLVLQKERITGEKRC